MVKTGIKGDEVPKEEDMLTPELEKLKRKLEGETVIIDEELLLKELQGFERGKLESLIESYGLSGKRCKSCGQLLE